MHKCMSMATVGLWLLATSLAAQNSNEARGMQASISGAVFDSRTHKPLVGANVVVIPNGPGAATDASGEFVLNFSVGREQRAAEDFSGDSLRVSFMGYRPVTLALAASSGALNIQLESITLLFSETVVTATRQTALRAEVPAATELVEIGTPQTVARQNVGEALAQAQSVFVKEYGGVSGLKTINLRGASDGQVLVLEDGVRLNNPQNGGVDAGILSLVGIERIEIVRGNASAQYGSDAIGGVIHLRSLSPPEGFSGAAQTSGGSFGTFNSQLLLGYGSARWRASVAVDRLVSDGDFAFEDSSKIKHRANNGSQRREIFARFSGALSNDLRLNILHRSGKTGQGAPGALQFPSALARQQDLNHLTSAAADWHVNSLLQLSAQFSAERRDQHYDDPNPFFPFASRHRVASDIGILQNRARFAKTLELLIGGEIGHYRAASTDLGKPRRTQRSVFAQAEWRPLAGKLGGAYQLAVIPSLRYDDYSDAGGRSSPKLALALARQAATRLSLHGSFGKSFRVPSMNDLWYKDPFFAGNPNLRPEKGREIEGGVLYEFSRAGNWQLELAAFDSKLADLIILTPDFSSVENANKAKINGVEFSAAWRSNGDRLGWRANYTLLSAQNDGNDPKTNGKDLVYRPHDKFDLLAHFDLHYLTLGGSLQFVGRRFANGENTKSLPAYRLANFLIAREVRWGDFSAMLQAEVRNVFDKHFNIIDGYPMPGREYRAILKLAN